MSTPEQRVRPVRRSPADRRQASQQAELDTAASIEPQEMLHIAGEVCRTGVLPARETTARVREQSHRVEELGRDELYDLLTPAFVRKHPPQSMQWLLDVGIMERLLPELSATVALSQEAGRRHKDVWEHTKTVVWQAVPRPEVRWAAVLHDVGKVPTRKFLPNGKVSFLGHAEVGVRMLKRGVFKRIVFPPAVRERVEALVLYHLRPGQYDGSWTDAAVRRFGRDMGPVLRDLLDLGRADVTSRRPGKRRACLRNISELSRRIRALEAEASKPRPLPPGLGNLLMTELALPPGKHLAVLRDRLQALCEEGVLEGGLPAEAYVTAVREHDLLAGVTIMSGRK